VARSKTPSFICEIPLQVSGQQEKELLSRFQAGRQLYNACLHEAMVRMEWVRQSEAYQSARQLPKGKERTAAFRQARLAYRYSEYDLHAFATHTAKSAGWIADKVDANTQQKLATRAFQASEKVLYGKAKSVRFKLPSRFRSMEGKTNTSGIRWQDGQLVWGKLRLKALIQVGDLVIQHGLSSSVKYVRLLWRDLNGTRRWYAQLVCEGYPYQKPKNAIAAGQIGLDLNVSNVAFVADDGAGLLPFAEGVDPFEQEIAKLQRQMERSRRATNPDNYEPDTLGKKGNRTVKKKGKAKKGKRQWKKSQNYKRRAKRKRELERRKVAYAKSQNRKLVNQILRHGKAIKTEKVSVKGWQKRYGKAIAAKSPSFFMSELTRKAENASGSVVKFSTQTTALSQTHLNGERIKKSLSQRIHRDVSGFEMQRDLFSAYLARHVDQDKLSLRSAQAEWERLEPTLMAAWERYRESAKRVAACESGKADPSPEQIAIVSR
jgi:transposase